MILAHRIQMKPTQRQENYFCQACGTARFVWNWALAQWKAGYTAGQKPKASILKAKFNKTKYEQFPWMKDVHRDAHSQPFADLQKAFSSFFKKKARYPKFKSKHRSKDSFYVANDKLRLEEQRVRLPVVGWIRLTEALRLEGKVLSARVSRTADRWFLSVQVDVGDVSKPRVSDEVLGVDLGLNSFAVLSNGEKFGAPKPLKKKLKVLKRRSRSHSRKQKGSNRRRKAAKRLARLHWRISNIRKDFIHKMTTALVSRAKTLVIEDLHVKGMMKNRKMARAISDSGWSEFRRQLDYKSNIFGTKIIIADRFFPSSKTCSSCGCKKEHLGLSEREFICESCGFVEDRDVNAALNLKSLATPGYGESHARGHQVRPSSVRKDKKEAQMVEARISSEHLCSPRK